MLEKHLREISCRLGDQGRLPGGGDLQDIPESCVGSSQIQERCGKVERGKDT